MAFNIDFHAKFGSKVAWKWRKLALFYFRATATVQFFSFAPPRRAPPFLVRASGAMVLKVEICFFLNGDHL